MLLPIAYVTFYIMMNSPSLLGDDAPQGAAKRIWNSLMAVAATAATAAGISAVMKKAGLIGLAVVGVYLGVVLCVQVMRRTPDSQQPTGS